MSLSHVHPVAGADAARVGARTVWAVVELRPGRPPRVTVEDDLRRIADAVDLVAVDIPIGLPGQEGVALVEGRPTRRLADAEARDSLPGRRRSCIFWAPTRQAYEAATYGEARARQPSLSSQAFALKPRVLEVEELFASGLPVAEFHPEVSFHRLAAGTGPRFAKKSWNGQRERRRILAAGGIELPELLDGEAGALAPDDVLDAAAGALTAQRIVQERAKAFGAGEAPLLDLPGVLWYPV